MKRRQFLVGTFGAFTGLGTLRSAYAAKPCHPDLTGDGAAPARMCPPSGNLAESAASLAPGQSVNITPNTGQASYDVQWNVTTVFYDANRREIQYMGKPASGQSLEYTHYVYDEDADAWITVGRPVFEGSGHVWCYAFDHANGDYYASQSVGSKTNTLKRFNRSSGVSLSSWETLATVGPTTDGHTLDDGNIDASIWGWHPNLFGPGKPGLYAHGAFRGFAYDPSEDYWHLLMDRSWSAYSDDRADFAFARNNGTMIYCPASDRLVIFGNDKDSKSGGDPIMWLEAGAGNSSNVIDDGLLTTTTNTTSPPIKVYGAGGSTVHGHVVNHPLNPNRLLLLEERGGARVWDSNDYGDSWSLKGYTHPFNTMRNRSEGEWTCGVVPPYGVVIAITSDSDGGEVRIWKPGD